MLFKTRSAAVYGIEAYVVDVEVNISTGESGKFYISGLPDAAVRESRSRIIASIRNNGFTFPYQAITVNLAPADVKKEGSAATDYSIARISRNICWSVNCRLMENSGQCVVCCLLPCWRVT
jgi:predicted ATPase with chaperone activity